MLTKALSIVLSVTGMILVYFTIKEKPKRLNRSIQYRNELDKYIRYQYIFDLFEACSYSVIGFLSAFKIVDCKHMLFLVLIFLVISTIIKRKIDKLKNY